jgi:hypothetical protein
MHIEGQFPAPYTRDQPVMPLRRVLLHLPDECFDGRGPSNVIHAFAVCRHDAFQTPEASLHDRLRIKKIVFSRVLAESEADRLNRLNGSKNVQYFVITARIECEPDEFIETGNTS